MAPAQPGELRIQSVEPGELPPEQVRQLVAAISCLNRKPLPEPADGFSFSTSPAGAHDRWSLWRASQRIPQGGERASPVERHSSGGW